MFLRNWQKYKEKKHLSSIVKQNELSMACSSPLYFVYKFVPCICTDKGASKCLGILNFMWILNTNYITIYIYTYTNIYSIYTHICIISSSWDKGFRFTRWEFKLRTTQREKKESLFAFSWHGHMEATNYHCDQILNFSFWLRNNSVFTYIIGASCHK